jgi:site-specific DNA-cytosine methylase
VGNAVPVLMAKAIAEKLKTHIAVENAEAVRLRA